jgi:hypothetical protein
MPYDDSFRLEMVTLADELETELEDLRMVEAAVQLVTVTRTGADPDAGTPGTATATPTTISPRPDWDPRDQWRSVAGERVRVGDGLLTFTRTITRAAILAADHFLIDGVKYRLADGWLKRGELRWEAVVVRYR